MRTKLTLEQIEDARAQEQARLDNAKSQVERNRLGQFATPPGLARAMARLALAHWPSSKRVRFLDPGVGSGAFYSALRAEFPKRQIARSAGVEVDADVAAATKRLWGADGLIVRSGDFTRLPVPASDERVNLILANPPYVRHHHLGGEDKVRLQRRVANQLGLGVSGLAGLYCHFLLLSDAWLEADGLAVWLIPSEFFDVNYGQVLREYLTTRVTLLRVHRFDPSEVQFDDALVSSVVLLFKKAVPQDAHHVLFTSGGSLDQPRTDQRVPLQKLGHSKRWTSFLNGKEPVGAESPRLGDFFRIKRGLATGANNFFILPRERAQALHLPKRFLRPILPSPRHIIETIVEADEDGYPQLPDQLVLIDCTIDERTLRKESPALLAYFQEGIDSGLSARYLASTRDPWYQQEERGAAPFLCTYMGRGVGKVKPFRFIWNKSAATAPNVYLLLYPTGTLKEKLLTDPTAASKVFQFLDSIGAETLRNGGRVYGGGLHKVEPKELANLSAQKLADALKITTKHDAQLPLFIVADRRSRRAVAGVV